MDFDDMIRRYFGTSQLPEVSANGLAAGIEHMLVDFGLERDRGKRFALWSLLYMLSSALYLNESYIVDYGGLMEI
jgi:hypothetical protein